MMREWLPHLLVAIFALCFAIFANSLSTLDPEERNQVQTKWRDVVTPGWNETGNHNTVQLPPAKWLGWSSLSLGALGGFYLAAALAGFVHRTEYQ